MEALFFVLRLNISRKARDRGRGISNMQHGAWPEDAGKPSTTVERYYLIGRAAEHELEVPLEA